MRKHVIWLAVGLLVVVGGWWIWKQSSRPLPGQEVEDMGRGHVADISSVTYNSNPPTSGPHFALWAKAGVYDRAVSDGYIIHSLEHGYVVISYDCTKSFSNVYADETGEPHEEPFGSAQGESGATGSARSTDSGQARPLTRMQAPPSATQSWFTPENPPAREVELPESFASEDCKKLVAQLADAAKAGKRVVVVPRPANDTLVALTAWGRIDKMEKFDKGRIEEFIGAFHNRGPEKTIE